MSAVFHLVYFGIPCLLDRSTSKEVQQHTQTLDLIWSVYGTAVITFSVYCILVTLSALPQHFLHSHWQAHKLTVLRSTSFSIMTLSLMFLMATFVTTVTAMNAEETPTAGSSITWIVTDLTERRGTVGRGELAEFCTQNSDGDQNLANSRLQSVVRLAATYSMPLIYHALRKLVLNSALWGTEALNAFPPNYALEWIETPDAGFNYGTTYYFDARYPANSWKDSAITQPDINWEPTQADFTFLGLEDADDYGLDSLLFMTLFGTLAYLSNKVTLAEQLVYKGVTLSFDLLRNCYRALEHRQLMNATPLYVMSNTYFYMAVPKLLLSKATLELLRKLDSTSDPEHVFNTMKTLILVTSGLALPGFKDWLDITSEKNLHFTARGALMMALNNYKNLAPNCRSYYAKDTVVLLRFKMDMRKIANLNGTGNLWLWNRHYWEHSFAFNYDDWTFNLNEFRTLRTFVFKTPTNIEYNFEDFAALMDTFMEFTPNYVWNHHLPLPNSEGMQRELQRIQNSEARNSRSTEQNYPEEAQSFAPLRRLFRKLRGNTEN